MGATSRVALEGDLDGLKAAVVTAERQGELGRSRVRELAGAVLSRELSSLQDPVEHFPDVTPCATRVQGVLEDVASGSGEAATLASLVLIDAGVRPRSVPEHSASGLAVEARQAVGLGAAPRRRAFLLHGDADVRRAALEAARESAQPGDVDALLEAARLDPDPEARSLAIVALGAVGGERAVLGLDDLWPLAGPEERRQTVLAWSAPKSAKAGGIERLVNIAELSSGTPAVLAALALARLGQGPPGVATAVLLRAIQGPDTGQKLLALYEAPWSNPELRAAIVAVRASDAGAGRVMASLRLVEHGELDDAGREDLRQLAQDAKSHVGAVARAVLAQAGDVSVKAGLRADLAAARSDQRTLAAFALVTLDDWAGAALALGDDSPRVRQAVACQMLADAPALPEGAGLERAKFFGPLTPELVALLAPEH